MAKSKTKENHRPGRRGLWKGAIAFGLVNIPVVLESAQQEEKIHFRLIDKRDHSPVGYKQINKSTGKEVSLAADQFKLPEALKLIKRRREPWAEYWRRKQSLKTLGQAVK